MRIFNLRTRGGLAARAIVIGLCLIIFMPQVAFCQSELPKFEAAAQYVFMDYPGFDQTEHGVGGRFTYNAARFFAVEGEIDFFPQKRPVLNAIHSSIQDYRNSRRMIGLFGVKTGIRRQRFGIFGKARPGFFYLSEGEFYLDSRIVFFRAPDPAQSQLHFAFDAGGIIEFYSSRRSYLRVDGGDTMIHFTRSHWGDLGIRDFLSHNFQLNVGAGFRF